MVYENLRNAINVTPVTKSFVLDMELTQKLLTHVILGITEKTSQELGLVGHTALYDMKTKKNDIVSKFKLSKVSTLVKKFGAEDYEFPDLEKLAGYLYVEEDGMEIYEIDEKRDEVLFRWHSNLTAAALVDVSLLSNMLKFEYLPVVNPSKKEQKKKEIKQKVPMIMVITVAFPETRKYNPKEVNTFLEKNGLL